MLPKDESDYLALKALLADCRRDPENVGWYIASAYWLGKGRPVDEVLASPPKKTNLRVVYQP